MKLNRIYRARYVSMLGDCDECGHSAIYHVPLLGCMKCSCSEFH